MFKAKDIMQTNVLSVTKDTPVREAINIEMHLVGIVSEKDVLKLLYNLGASDGYVEDYMTRCVVSFDVDDDLLDVCESLIQNGFRRVPILAGGKLAGIISRRDIISHIQKHICMEKTAV
ncbi:MAG TPA: CBS domain-containing protein [Sedimentisphaerales bacterium]|nr:CBS domain-containing protein [Sedimentisphaerales bacterium]